MRQSPNIVFILIDQLRASSLPDYGENQIETPNISRLAAEGTKFTNALSTAPVCTPYRSMMLTGRHPQSTGHLINFIDTRHDEIGLGDVFAHAGYRTGWIGKWHLHRGSFPQIDGPDFVPEGRDRLGFQHWRGYNFHRNYFNGTVNVGDWRYEHWEGYETDALNRYAMEFIDSVEDQPFCCFISPHQVHPTHEKYAPDHYFARLPDKLTLPANVPPEQMEDALERYREYLAMTLAVDDMVGEMRTYLERKGLLDDTIFVFTSDHGTQMGAHGWQPWDKKVAYEESIRVPLIIRWPGHFEAGSTCDALTTPVDLLPTLCGLCGIKSPKTVEGYDLSDAWLGKPEAFEQEGALTMNFTRGYDYMSDGGEWRGVRTKRFSYVKWLDGRKELFDLPNDPLQLNNLTGEDGMQDEEAKLEAMLDQLLKERQDQFEPASAYENWFDLQRRVVRNATGPLPHPDTEPDWSLLE